MITVKMVFERACKNSVVYKSKESESAIRSLYLMNDGYNQLKQPRSIVVTINDASEVKNG